MPGFGMLGATLQTIEEVVPFFNSTVEKQVDGLIFWDNFNRPNTVSGLGNALVGGSWDLVDGDMEIFSLRARGDGAFTVNTATNSASVAIGKDFIFGGGWNGQAAGQVVRLNYHDPENTEELRFGVSNTITTIRGVTGSSTTIIADGPGGVPYGDDYIARFIGDDVGGGEMTASFLLIGVPSGGLSSMAVEFTGSIDIRFSGSGIAPEDAEGLKVQLGGQALMDNTFICRRSISVVNLGTGQKMRLMGPSLTRSIVIEDGSGTASLSVDEFALPMDRVEVLDTDDSILGAFESASYIWGGDEFKFTSASYQ